MSSLVMIDRAVIGANSMDAIVTGIDGTYDHYVVFAKNLGGGYNKAINYRVTKSGTPLSDSDYEYAGRVLYNGGIRAETNTGNSYGRLTNNWGANNDNNYAAAYFEMHLYNFAASDYDYILTYGNAGLSNDSYGYPLINQTCVVKDATASDGIQIMRSSSEDVSFVDLGLYGVT
tara:strand:+ start:111 stop:632 length:522 start_codon:yes stop_codon:yes gene_type:complete